MRFALMALAAERDDLPIGGRVTIVAILATDLRFMLASGCSNVCRRLAVAFNAVIIRKRRGRGGCCRIGGECQALHSNKGETGTYD